MNNKLIIYHGLVHKNCRLKMLMFIMLLSFNLRAQQSKTQQQQFEAIAMPKSTIEWLDVRPEVNISHTDFVSGYLSILNLAAGSNMRLLRAETDEIGFTHFRYQQYVDNTKVIGGEMIIHENNGRVASINGKYLQANPANKVPAIDEAAGLMAALKEIKSTDYLWLNEAAEANYKAVRKDEHASMYPKGEVVYMRASKSLDAARSYYLCWKYDINVNPQTESYTVYIDAVSGKMINKIPLTFDCSTGSSTTLWNGARTIYTQFVAASNTYRSIDDCQSTLISTRNGNGSDTGTGFTYYTDADNAWSTSALQEYVAQTHWGVKQTYNYYTGVHSRTSYDNAGQTMISYLNPGFTGNAYWTTATQAASFGGSSTGTSPYTTLDVNGHEHTHGVTEHTSNLAYQDESGALNESYSDIFGEMVESWAIGTPDWIHRAEISGGNRSFIDPKSKGHPDTYLGTNWYSGTSDNGGVHTNSSVQNHWFYLLSEGGSGTNDNGTAYNITGISRFTARLICYRALTLYLNSGSEYIDARAASLHAAFDLYGSCSTEIEAVGQAWRAVGVESQSSQYNENVCGTYPASGTSLQAIHQLTAANGCTTNVTASATTVYFSAADRVILYPGFRAISGSKFYAYIEPCAISLYRSSDADANGYMSDAEKGIVAQQAMYDKKEKTVADDFSIAPNPVSDAINITITLKESSPVSIDVYDILGNKIESLDNYDLLSHGYHTLTYSAEKLSSGIYYINVTINGESHNKKIVKVKN